ncbi:MAG: hypothetical protein ACI4TX_04690 [Christensenellales bacterium]
MFKTKKNYILSNESLEYIKKYMIDELNIKSEIDSNILAEMVQIADSYECLLADYEEDKSLNFDMQKSLDSCKFVDEVSGHWAKNLEPDFDDLNKRLNLKK